MAQSFSVSSNPKPPVAAALISRILASPHRRLVRTVVRDVPLPSFSTSVPDTPNVTDAPPWLGELMSSVREMRGLLSEQMVTRDQFERYHIEYSNLVVPTAEEAVSPIRQDLATLTTRVEVLKNSGDLVRDPIDPALRRITVLGIE